MEQKFKFRILYIARNRGKNGKRFEKELNITIVFVYQWIFEKNAATFIPDWSENMHKYLTSNIEAIM